MAYFELEFIQYFKVENFKNPSADKKWGEDAQDSNLALFLWRIAPNVQIMSY